MNVLLYSLQGVALSLVHKIRQEGHEVILYIDQPDCRAVGDGIVFKTTDPDSIAAQADLIIFDDNGMGKAADSYREKGYNVFGGGTFVDKLEYDRLYGMEVFREHGIKIPDTYEVHDLAAVKECLASEFEKGEKLVIKLDGADMAGTSFSFVAKDPVECEEQVEHWIEDGLLPGKWSGIIQRFVAGIECSIAAWWDGEKFTTHALDLEEKKMLSGNLGPSVGCAYNTIIRVDKDSKLFKMQLEPLAPFLKKNGYIGEIDTNSIIGEDGIPYALEFTPRLGWDSCPTLAWGNNHGFVNKILHVLGLGGEFEGFGYQGRIWGGLRVYTPPYPSSDCESACGVPILGHEKIEDDFYLYDAMRSERGELVCAGTSGIIGVAMGAGDDPREAATAAYRIADRIRVPDRGWRALDGSKRHQDALQELRASRMIRLYPELP